MQSAGLQQWGDVEFCRSIEIRAAGGGVPSHLPSSKARAPFDGEIYLHQLDLFRVSFICTEQVAAACESEAAGGITPNNVSRLTVQNQTVLAGVLRNLADAVRVQQARLAFGQGGGHGHC